MNLTGKMKVGYGLGACAKDMVYMLAANFVLYYYQDILGVSAITMGVIILGARIFDAVNDPLVGILVSKTHTRWGKFRPWILVGTLLNAVVLYLLFSAPPTLDGTGMVAYAAIFYVLWGLTYTCMDIPFWAMIPAFTKAGSEREGLTGLGKACAGVGDVIITVATMKAVLALGGGNEHTGFRWFTLIICVVYVLFILAACFFIHDKSDAEMQSTGIKDMFRALFRNDQAMTVILVIILTNLAFYVFTGLLIYYFKYDFGGEGWADGYTIFNTFGGLVQIGSMCFIYPIFRKFMSSALKTFYTNLIICMVGMAILLGMMTMGVKVVYALFLPAFLIYMSVGVMIILMTVFLANTVEYGELKNGHRDEALIFSLQTFVVKVASGVAVLIVSISLALANLSKDTAATVSSTASGSLIVLHLGMTMVPFIGFLVAFLVLKKKYILNDQKMDEITSQLEAR